MNETNNMNYKDLYERCQRYLEERNETIKELKTLPTEEEVCKALSEYLGKKYKVYFDNFTNILYIEDIEENYNFTGELFKGQLDLDLPFLPVNLVLLIIKFYSGLIRMEEN